MIYRCGTMGKSLGRRVLKRTLSGVLSRMIAVGLWAAIFLTGCGGDNDTTPALSVAGSSWTVMVYLDGDNNLEEWALADFNEMEAAATDENLHLIVLFDRSPYHSEAQGDWEGTRLYKIRHDTDTSSMSSVRLTDSVGLGLAGDESDELNMGRSETLRQFVSFCKEAYPSDYTALILWDHGSGWAPSGADTAKVGTKFIAIDDASSGDALSMKEVADALSGQPVDLLGFDACLMAEAEVAWELRDSARYMVASEMLEPSTGWNYTDFLNRFAGVSGVKKTPEVLGRIISETYLEGGGDMGLSLSVTDLKALPSLGAAVDALALEMMALGPEAVTSARNEIPDYNDDTCVDLRRFAEALGVSSETRTVLGAALSRAVIVNGATNLDEICGLSIYFPLFGVSSGQYGDYTSLNLDFVDDTEWAGALRDYKNRAPYYTVDRRDEDGSLLATPGSE
ncbi:clostripain-related cysteine peptidase [Desulfoluna sp.]|uniref:clostripain-related cysteine peptidase n=1 Tax=Desulfoluna sp. TaxID=2045199 RepID=UPI002612F8FE|nr:clostripain-related cysteine peptidase [Desulfoluna sp.]